jgi:hypothetical protein
MRTDQLQRVLLASVVTLAAAACGRASAEFGPPRALSNTTTVGAAPMFAVSPKGDEAAAWISAPGGGTDGSLYVSVNGAAPAIIRDTLGPIEPHGESPPKLAYAPDGSLSALYVVGKVIPGRRFPAAAMRFVRSPDGGRTWSPPATVTDDSVFGAHNFHALHASADGTLFVSWLDGREGKSAVFLTRSTDGGKTWEPNRRIAEGEACPCCRTAIATGAGGVVYLAWREVADGNVRDIVVAKSTDGGRTFGPSSRVHADGWVYDGCPHAGPSLLVDAKGRVHAAWWTGKEGAAGVWYARSDDGERFGEPVALGVAKRSSPSHVQLAFGAGDVVVAAWDDGTSGHRRALMRVSRDGGASFAATSVLSDAGDAATFPVLAVRGDSVTVAWTSQSEVSYDKAERERPDMKMRGMMMPLPAVGEARVIVRRGRVLR